MSLTYGPLSASIGRGMSAAPAPLRYGAVVIGASAGGVRVLGEILALLPADFPLPILIVLHLSRTQDSRLAEVLGYRSRLPVAWARWGERAVPGRVYVAPRDRHLLLQSNGRLALSNADPVAWWRPAVDRLFESAAAALGPRAIGVVLSGALWDGTRGIAAIREAGGVTIAQDEQSSDHFEMPAGAIDIGGADIVLPPAKIAEALQVLAGLLAEKPAAA
ncbi:chemotaxis protein CheB [Sphingomonas changbaiensis]|nr:chemotaxis protein CheB [Sphingomonas changbaiensis]